MYDRSLRYVRALNVAHALSFPINPHTHSKALAQTASTLALLQPGAHHTTGVAHAHQSPLTCVGTQLGKEQGKGQPCRDHEATKLPTLPSISSWEELSNMSQTGQNKQQPSSRSRQLLTKPLLCLSSIFSFPFIRVYAVLVPTSWPGEFILLWNSARQEEIVGFIPDTLSQPRVR